MVYTVTYIDTYLLRNKNNIGHNATNVKMYSSVTRYSLKNNKTYIET